MTLQSAAIMTVCLTAEIGSCCGTELPNTPTNRKTGFLKKNWNEQMTRQSPRQKSIGMQQKLVMSATLRILQNSAFRFAFLIMSHFCLSVFLSAECHSHRYVCLYEIHAKFCLYCQHFCKDGLKKTVSYGHFLFCPNA